MKCLQVHPLFLLRLSSPLPLCFSLLRAFLHSCSPSPRCPETSHEAHSRPCDPLPATALSALVLPRGATLHALRAAIFHHSTLILVSL